MDSSQARTGNLFHFISFHQSTRTASLSSDSDITERMAFHNVSRNGNHASFYLWGRNVLGGHPSKRLFWLQFRTKTQQATFSSLVTLAWKSCAEFLPCIPWVLHCHPSRPPALIIGGGDRAGWFGFRYAYSMSPGFPKYHGSLSSLNIPKARYREGMVKGKNAGKHMDLVPVITVIRVVVELCVLHMVKSPRQVQANSVDAKLRLSGWPANQFN